MCCSLLKASARVCLGQTYLATESKTLYVVDFAEMPSAMPQVMSGMLVAPRVPEAAERLELQTLVDTCALSA